MKAKVQKILNHNIDIFVNRQLIYNYPEQLLAEKGVMVIEHADFDGIERLAAVTGGDIISTFDSSAGLINQPIQLHHSELEQAVPNNPVVMTKSTLTLEGDDGTDSSNVNATTTVLSQPTNTVETINKPSIKRYHLQKEHRHFCPHSLTHPHTSSLSELFKQHLMNHPSTIASSFVYPQQHMTAMNSSSKKRKRQSETTLITESSNCASAPMEISRRLSTELGDDGGNDDDNDNKEETAEYIFRRIREIFDMNGG
jgi:hypothetical protein